MFTARPTLLLAAVAVHRGTIDHLIDDIVILQTSHSSTIYLSNLIWCMKHF